MAKKRFRPTKVKLDSSDRFLRGLTCVLFSVFTVVCVIPFWLIIASSFSSEAAIRRSGFTLWPSDFSLYSYQLIAMAPDQLLGSYGYHFNDGHRHFHWVIYHLHDRLRLTAQRFPFPQRHLLLHLLYLAVFRRSGTVLLPHRKGVWLEG